LPLPLAPANRDRTKVEHHYKSQIERVCYNQRNKNPTQNTKVWHKGKYTKKNANRVVQGANIGTEASESVFA
jgi:hypothetical protein